MSVSSKKSKQELINLCTMLELSTSGTKEELCQRIDDTLENNSKLIGTGATGCVYYPPLPCLEPCDDERCITGVSKLMNRVKAESEVMIYAKLQLDQLDPTESYFIRKPLRCKPKPNKHIKACSIEINDPELLIYENGGQNLYKIISKQQYPASHVLYFLKNIFEAVKLLSIHKITDSDLKTENIVVGVDGRRYRLIDFGLSDFPTGPKIVFQNIYFVWPIDAILTNKSVNIDTHITNYMNDRHIITVLKPYYEHQNWWNRYTFRTILDSLPFDTPDLVPLV